MYFEARPGKRLQLGISVGAAVFPHDGESYEALLATADSRMYRDKASRKRRSGRGTRATGAGAPPARPPARSTDVDIQRPRPAFCSHAFSSKATARQATVRRPLAPVSL